MLYEVITAGLVGLTDFDINMPRDMAEAYRGVDKKVVSTGEPVEMIEQVHTSEGELRWVDTSKSPLTDERGNIIGVLGVFDDITERKQLEEALEKRILSLTTPLESNEKICFDDLFSLDEIQKFQDVFSQATGVGCMIVDPDGVPRITSYNVCYTKLLRIQEIALSHEVVSLFAG